MTVYGSEVINALEIVKSYLPVYSPKEKTTL